MNFEAGGSILADDMGLGKTLTTLSLVQITRQESMNFQTRHSEDCGLPGGGTLIICPLATLTNWAKEIEMHFQRSSLSYLIFHGSKRRSYTREMLVSKQIVLTTYETFYLPRKSPIGEDQDVNLMEIYWYRVVLDEAQ